MAEPGIGEMVLHDYIEPPLRAGRYRLDISTSVQVDSEDQPLDGQQAYFNIDGPRFGLGPGEVAGLFPPRNGHGPFDETIPHVALGRRTLPWERLFAAARPTFNGVPIPWLALLMFEDGECVVEVRQPIGSKLPAEVVARLGVPGDLLVDTVTAESRLIRDLMPSYEELTLLAHVRQVNVEDRELAAGDSDGYFAVLMSNRVPQRGKKYRCCLVSVEERTDLVPERPPAVALDFHLGDIAIAVDSVGLLAAAAVPPPGSGDSAIASDAAPELLARAAALREAEGRLEVGRPNPGDFADPGIAGASDEAAGPSRFDAALIGDIGLFAGSRPSAAGSVAATFDARRLDWRLIIPTDTLVLLSTWTFECAGSASFRALTQALDVGMIGKPHEGGPALTDTGHQRLDLIDRAGAPETVFYRGPLVATPLSRDGNGPYHNADQARRVAPEVGAEDVSYACAFEVGRLLAAADARLAQELMRWRRSAFDRSVRADSQTFVQQWAGISSAIDPLTPIALPFAMSAVEQLVKGAGPIVDPFEIDKLEGVPGFDLALVRQTFALADDVEARALLGEGDGLLTTTIAVDAVAATRRESIADVIGDTAGIGRLLGERERLIDNMLSQLDPEGEVQ